jgi:toxin YoeB
MIKIWHPRAWDEYTYWQGQDKRTLRKINLLVKDIERKGYSCIGKPEPLKGNLSGWWSVEINEKDRLVFRLSQNDGLRIIEVLSCKGHYQDK